MAYSLETDFTRMSAYLQEVYMKENSSIQFAGEGRTCDGLSAVWLKEARKGQPDIFYTVTAEGNGIPGATPMTNFMVQATLAGHDPKDDHAQWDIAIQQHLIPNMIRQFSEHFTHGPSHSQC